MQGMTPLESGHHTARNFHHGKWPHLEVPVDDARVVLRRHLNMITIHVWIEKRVIWRGAYRITEQGNPRFVVCVIEPIRSAALLDTLEGIRAGLWGEEI